MSVLCQTCADTIRTDYAHENSQHKERTIRMPILQRTLSEYAIVQGARESAHEKRHLPVSAL